MVVKIKSHHHRAHHNHDHDHKHHHRHKPKKKVGLFYKISISALVILSLIIAYFVILVSANPKAAPRIAQKVESKIKEQFGNDAKVGRVYAGFTSYGTFKILVENVRINYKPSPSSNNESLSIPKLEAEFSLLNLILFNFSPSSIKIINPQFLISNQGQNIANTATQETSSENYLASILTFISKEKGIKKFEIENANLNIGSRKILIKKSKIRASYKSSGVKFRSENKFSLDPKKPDIDFKSNCKLLENSNLKCEFLLMNFSPNSIADFHPSLKSLDKINGFFSAQVFALFENNKVSTLSFIANSQNGNFQFPGFFDHRLAFSNLIVKGDYIDKEDSFSFSEISADFLSSEKLPKAPRILMSSKLSGVKSENQKIEFDINLKNIPISELEKFWPSNLENHGIKDWVTSHIKGGNISEASTKFLITKSGNSHDLNSINAKINFSGANLLYNEHFPEIKNITATAIFTKNAMKISIANGSVLSSKIYDSSVTIDNFHADNIDLNIFGKSSGPAYDLLKHVDYKSDFASKIEQYLNGNSENNFDIRVPLSHEITLKNTYIAANSTVTNFKNDYAQGAIIINTKKDVNNYNFATNIDFTTSTLSVKELDISKKINAESALTLLVDVSKDDEIGLKNIFLYSKEDGENSSISGNIQFKTAPFGLQSVNLKNSFAQNDYSLSFDSLEDSSEAKALLMAKKINLSNILNQKSSSQNPLQNFKNFNIQGSAQDVLLRNKKRLRNFYIYLKCAQNSCQNISAKGSYGKKQSINFSTTKKSKDIQIDGRITDIGYLAEGLGISDAIALGDAKIKLKNKEDGKRKFIEGEIVINNDVTFYENAAIKKFAKNDLFSQVKDKIFSNNKTTFNFVKVEFTLENRVLTITSLVANNYKIGITAKGFIDLKNHSYEIKGMIIPGFIVNNLFGIGNIPILGSVVSGLLTGGEGGGLFGVHYEYTKTKNQQEPVFTTNKVSAFVPVTIRSLFDMI